MGNLLFILVSTQKQILRRLSMNSGFSHGLTDRQTVFAGHCGWLEYSVVGDDGDGQSVSDWVSVEVEKRLADWVCLGWDDSELGGGRWWRAPPRAIYTWSLNNENILCFDRPWLVSVAFFSRAAVLENKSVSTKCDTTRLNSLKLYYQV